MSDQGLDERRLMMLISAKQTNPRAAFSTSAVKGCDHLFNGEHPDWSHTKLLGLNTAFLHTVSKSSETFKLS